MKQRPALRGWARAAPVAFAAFAAFVMAWGCSEFATVGGFAGDAGSGAFAPATMDAGEPPGERTTLDGCMLGEAPDLDAGAIAALLAGGDAGALRWLYPYDGTVFPGGLQAPLVMWDGAPGDAVLVHLHSTAFDYRGCFVPAAPGQLPFPQKPWDLAQAAAAGPGAPFTLELTVRSGGKVMGPISEQLVIAAGALPGSVYIMAFGSNTATSMGGIAAIAEPSILRIRPGQAAQLVLGGSVCVGCHSLSADGSRLAAYANGMGASFAMSASTAPNPAPAVTPTPGGEYAGLAPDGAIYVAGAHPAGVGPQSYGAGVMTAGLYETATGTAIAGSGIPGGAMMPAFSSDGSLLAFNDYAIQSGHGLAIMDFSESARMATNYRVVFPGSESMNYPGWPTFLPDDKALVFSLGQASNFSGSGTGLGIATPGPQTDLYLVDTSSHAVTLLAKAMGFTGADDAASNTTYLPFGAADVHQNYDPAVSPGASGGYAWVFFDSRRNYGNAGLLRAIWCAAVDVSPTGTYSADPSHPPFFMPGQELTASTIRPVPVLDP
jgi:hypothetical protein